MSSLYTYNKQQFNSDVSFNGITTFNNTSTQITSSGTVGLRGVGGVDISSGGVITIGGSRVNVSSDVSFNRNLDISGTLTTGRNTITCGSINCRDINTNSYNVNFGTGGVTCGSVNFPSGIINGSGSVGIGTTTPAQKLDVSGAIACINLIRCTQTGTNNTNIFDMGTEPSSGNGHFIWGYGDKQMNFGTNGTSRMTILGNGNVGIGLTNPGYKLDVTGNTRSNGDLAVIGKLSVYGTGNGLWLNDGNGMYSDGPITCNGAISCKSINTNLYSITCGPISCTTINSNGYSVNSDRRIKTNIVDIDDGNALSILRKIQPKTYEYVDKKERGNDSVIGFIAQEIQAIIPKAVSLISKHIPNFYTNCQVAPTDVPNIVLVTSHIDLSWNPLHGSDGSAFIDAEGNACSDASGKKEFNVKLYDQSNNEIKCKTTSILDKRSFLMDISGSNVTNVMQGDYFLHGQEVDDFHTIDKSAIFTVVTAAVQDIDRIVQAQEAKISALEQQVASLQTQNAAFEARLTAKGF